MLIDLFVIRKFGGSKYKKASFCVTNHIDAQVAHCLCCVIVHTKKTVSVKTFFGMLTISTIEMLQSNTRNAHTTDKPTLQIRS